MGECIMFSRGVFEPFTVNPVFSKNDWSTIVKACRKRMVPDTWKVGDQKAVSIGGLGYTFNIIGKNHDDLADGSGKAPLTLQMNDLYPTTYKMNDSETSVGGWRDSVMRNTHLPAILATFSDDLRLNIREVTKKSSAGNGSTTIVDTVDKLFLLSIVEVVDVWDSKQAPYVNEGTRYEYYVNGNTTIKKLNNVADYWFTRSSGGQYNLSGFYAIQNENEGSLAGAQSAYARPIAFAFCL